MPSFLQVFFLVGLGFPFWFGRERSVVESRFDTTRLGSAERVEALMEGLHNATAEFPPLGLEKIAFAPLVLVPP